MDIAGSFWTKLACQYNSNMNFDCMDYVQSKTNIVRLTYDEVRDIEIFDQIGSGFYGQVYDAKFRDLDIVIKHLRIIPDEGSNSLIDEVCFQHKVSEIGLAPKILAYWECDDNSMNIIIMEKFKGITLKKYLATNQEDDINIFMEIVHNISTMNQQAGILHNDFIHFDNIMICDTDEVKFIDFGVSQRLPPYQDLIPLLPSIEGIKDYTQYPAMYYLGELVFFIKSFYDACKHILKNRIKSPNISRLLLIIDDYQLHEYIGWIKIYKQFYANCQLLPTPDDIVNIILNLTPRSIIVKCPYTPELFKCVKKYGTTNDIIPLGLKDVESITIDHIIHLTKNYVIYYAEMNGVPIDIIHTNNTISRLTICLQNKALGIAPKILGAWNCQKGVILTEHINGITLDQYMELNDNHLDIFLTILKHILYQTLELNILMRSLTGKNIIIDDDHAYFIDYSNAELIKLKRDDKLKSIYKYEDLFRDIKSLKLIFNSSKDLNLKSKISLLDIQVAYERFFAANGKIPHADEMYQFILLTIFPF